jgi:hypothetical protein
MMRQRRISSTNVALWVVAALLAMNLVATLARRDAPGLSVAWAADANAPGRQGPIAGGGGMFVMPAQLSGNTWGAYLMDIDRGTLCVYQFFPGTRQLQFVAARNFTNDTKLANFNTLPAPQEIIDLVDKQNKARGGADGAAPAPNGGNAGNNAEAPRNQDLQN